MHSIKQEIRATEPVLPEIPTSVFVISLHSIDLLNGFHDRGGALSFHRGGENNIWVGGTGPLDP